ncbi:glycoside hydrolase family 55 protein [Rhypophila decipiens]
MKLTVLASLLLAGAADRASAFWYNQIDHTTANVRGYAPDLDPDYSYPIYRAVSAGDGAGIQRAIDDATNPGSSRNNLWFASQPRGSQFQNVKIVMPTSASGVGETLGHTGIRMGRGSTLGLADVRIENGQTGILVQGHQQALFKSIYFYQNMVGMLITGGATFSIANPTFERCGFGVMHTGGSPYIALIDGKSINSGVTFKTTAWPNFLIENFEKDTTSTNIVEGPGTNVLSGRTYLAASSNKIAYFPFGKYRVDSTLLIPPGSRIVGEAWATIVGNGTFFKNSASPKPVVQVGTAGSIGTAQISDMRFTISDVLPGAIIFQVNMAPPSGKPGGVAIWNSLVTVGGTRGASALAASCNSDGSNQCKAAYLGIHLSSTSSTYIENVWNWVGDHTAEDFSGGSRIAGKGGVLVQSTQPTWLHALGSEHWWLYQLNLHRAQNVAVTLLQSETNYDQGDNNLQVPPAPWASEVNTATWGDRDFNAICASLSRPKRCRMGFTNYINGGGSNIFTYASASWAFFSGPNYQQCAGQYGCQEMQGLWSGWATGREINAQPDFTGSWSGGGGDVGRYTL